jgi:hypothetical protein
MPFLLSILKSIVLTFISSSVFIYLRQTRIGVKLEQWLMKVLTYLSNKLDLAFLKRDSKFPKHYPNTHKRISALEDKIATLEEQINK